MLKTYNTPLNNYLSTYLNVLGFLDFNCYWFFFCTNCPLCSQSLIIVSKVPLLELFCALHISVIDWYSKFKHKLEPKPTKEI